MLQQQWLERPLLGHQHGHSSRVSSARQSQKQHKYNRYDKTSSNRYCVTLGDRAGCDSASAQPGNAFVLVSFPSLPQGPGSKLPLAPRVHRQGRRDVRRLEEGGKLPQAAGCSRQAQPRASQSSSCPAPAVSAVRGWGSEGSHARAVPHCRAGSGRLWEPCLPAQVGYDGQWAQPAQGAAAESGQCLLPGRDHVWL